MKLKGSYRFEGFDKAGKKVFDRTYNNVIVQGLYTNFFKLLNGDAGTLTLTHMATGTGTNPALRADTALQTEFFRKAITKQSYTNLKYTCKLSIAAAESVTTIREIGVFANATDTPGSGVLVSRCSVNVPKNVSTQYLITYTIDTE